MKITATAASLTGRRPSNQDRCLISAGLALYAVADGMGGYAGGEIASALAIEHLERFVATSRRDAEGTWPCKEDKKLSFAENLLRAAIHCAHDAISAQRRGELNMMGSTLAVVLIDGRRATVAHVGDSRIYRLRDGTLTQLTRDHSLWAEMHAAGLHSGERAGFPHKNVITRALGIENHHRPDLATLELEPKDRLLICSDGFHDPFTPADIAALMAGNCDALARAAFDAGSGDNITAVLLQVLG